MIVEHLENQEVQAPQTPKPAAELSRQIARDTKPTLPPFIFPEPVPEPQPAYAPVNINELSTGLGLPSAKIEANEETSTIVSHESRVPQAHPGALYGKLIGWALDKPLTAKGLADFLRNQDVSMQPQAPAPISPARTIIRGKDESTPTKSKSSSTRGTKTPNSRRIVIPSPPETAARIKSQDAAVRHQHRRNSSAAPYRQHNRVPSQRYPRRPSRAKRSDQGPMPSAADIYPDDAHWTPSAPLHETAQDYVSHYKPLLAPEQPQMIIANPFNWPPPAQVYAPELPPTLTDIHAADTDVLELIYELPAPSLCTLAKLGNSHDLRATSAFGLESAGLKGDERALTPGQEDGSRYGIRFWGIGYGDQWEVPKIGKLEEGMFGGEAFRIRPREHEGWGEMQWALAKGWEY